MTCLLPLLLVILPSANPQEPVILPASTALKTAIAQNHPKLWIVKEAWLDGGANKMCQKQGKTVCADKVWVHASNLDRVEYSCVKTKLVEET